MLSRTALASAIVAALAAMALSPAPALADGPLAAAPEAAKPGDVPADYYCPDCRAPIRYDQDRCPHCGAEFEPIRPRVKKGEGPREESPFPAPPPDRPEEPRAPQIIPSPWRQIEPPAASRFGFGSYGRVGIDLRPNLDGARPLDVVDFRPRLEKGPYEELHFFYKDAVAGMPVLVKSTLAFQEKLFHYDGDFDAEFAVRELYAELNPTDSMAVWVGARMYRGDDIYIFDFWPLDDQNTLGGGVAFKLTDGQTLQAHVGFNRILDKNIFYQYQEIEVPAPDVVGTQKEVFLDRNRGVASLTYRAELPYGLRWKLHGEGHYLPSGTHRLQNGTDEHLPADHGFVVGTELEERFDPSFVRLFIKYGKGLGAYDELQIPFGFDTDFTVTESWRLLVGLGGAVDTSWFGMHWGAYWQRFQDSDGIDDRTDFDQFAIAARPEVYLGEYLRTGFEASWQGLEPDGIYAETGKKEFPQVTSLTFLAGVAAGRGVYARPALYLYYGLHWLNEGARVELGRRLAERPGAREDVMGLFAEWWF
jgi:maltoporin